jgi:hypothetical protein
VLAFLSSIGNRAVPIIEYKPNPPLRKGDRLFRNDLPDLSNNARLTPNGDGQTAYTEGYRRGAKVLVEHVVASGGHEKNCLVYPIIFLYRHHLELALKRIIRRAPGLLSRSLTKDEKDHLGKHRLDWLWQDLKPMFIGIFGAVGWEEPDQIDMEGVDDYIRQISELDRDGFSFRYAHSKEGDRLLPEHLKHINIRHFAEMMDRLVGYIDEIDTATSVVKEWQDDMEAEYGRDYSY